MFGRCEEKFFPTQHSGAEGEGRCPEEPPISFPSHGAPVNGLAYGNYLHLGTCHLEHVFAAWNQIIFVAPDITEERFSPHLNAR